MISFNAHRYKNPDENPIKHDDALDDVGRGIDEPESITRRCGHIHHVCVSMNCCSNLILDVMMCLTLIYAASSMCSVLTMGHYLNQDSVNSQG